MSGNPHESLRLDLIRADDPRDVIHRVVACLAQGGVAILPTESSYILAAAATSPDAVQRIRKAKGSTNDRPFSIGLRGPDELMDWVPDAGPHAKRLARRAWPGPMTIVLHGDIQNGLAGTLDPFVRSIVAPESKIGLRMPGHDALREVRALMSSPLILTDAPARDGGRAQKIADLATEIEVDMIVEHGPANHRERNSVIQIDSAGWSLLRSGAIPEDEIERMGGRIVLFVCTGNTCRSPMAEAICRQVLAEKLGCSHTDLVAKGFTIGSAGLAASRGSKAAREAAEVIKARGGSLADHSSRQLSPGMIHGADLIVAMTRDHREAILEEHPTIEDRVLLLHNHGLDIADPIGSDRATYQRTAQEIEAHIRGLLDTILSLN